MELLADRVIIGATTWYLLSHTMCDIIDYKIRNYFPEYSLCCYKSEKNTLVSTS